MFSYCTSLTEAPELPATTLQTSCYVQMFKECTSLEIAPELPATILQKSCYSNMFTYCYKLRYIKCLATDISPSNCTDYWVGSVSSNGIFVKDANTTWASGTSGIPYGWTVQDAS
jgi:hypothetical protein